jgi:hypothetical protein
MLEVPGVDAAVMDDIRGRLGEYAEMDDFEKEAALPELRRYLALYPDVTAIFGDVALRAKEALAKLAGANNPMLTERQRWRVSLPWKRSWRRRAHHQKYASQLRTWRSAGLPLTRQTLQHRKPPNARKCKGKRSTAIGDATVLTGVIRPRCEISRLSGN